MTADKFKFKRHASIGAAAAEEDERFLAECFIHTGDLTSLGDCSDPRRIVLGRTGIGKTALLNRLAEEKDSIVINPESLSFNYITNSNILQFFLEAGVNLDLFFKLLWRHVFTVELLKRKYNITNDDAKRGFLSRMSGILSRNKAKEKAISYLSEWGEHFWEETEYRVKEVTGRIENELRSSVGTKHLPVELSATGASMLSEEEKIEVVQRGQSVINDIQMKALTDVLEFLNEDVFTDAKHHYFICIDKLDENWVDDKFRYLLIRSLIETVRDFLRVRNVKIVVALRTDLIERVIRLTRGEGFQEEKYRSLYLQLRWTDGQLKELLDKRVNFLVRQSYTKKPVGYKDVLPITIDKQPAVQYMIDRTLMRPRELIEFFNDCIEQAEGKATITKTMVLTAEGEYSKNRLRSLQDEWITDYHSLIAFSTILKKKPKQFRLEELDRAELEQFCLDYSVSNPHRGDLLSVSAFVFAEGTGGYERFLQNLFHVFYRTGLVGLKTETYQGFQWIQNGPSSIAAETIGMETSVNIHPMFWRVLGIRPY